MTFKLHFSFLFLLLVCKVAAAEPPQSWLTTSLAVECKSGDILDVFEKIGELQSISLNVDEDVSGTCNGWIKHSNLVSFLDSISSSHGLSWYFFNNTLYISREKDFKVERIDISAELHAALRNLKLIEPTYGWSYLKDAQQVMVNGPTSYITNIKNLVSVKAKKQKKVSKPVVKKKKTTQVETTTEDKKEVFIIPVKHASVVDREIDIRGSILTIPGITSVLNGIINGGGILSDSAIADTDPSELLRIENKSSPASVRIEADVRTNSLAIHSPDLPESYFTDIIEQLDKPLKLVEIDAMIVDVNREVFNELGVRYGIRSQRNSDSVSIDNLNNAVGNISAILNIGDYARFFGELRLLEGKGQANIVANTSILTLENQPALIDLSSTFYIRNIGENVASVTPVTTGTLLNITPQLLEINDAEGRHEVQLFINVEDGKVQEQTVDGIPVISNSKINTKAVIAAGKSLVIGGHKLQSTGQSNRSVPFLSSIPIIKHLFTYKTTETQQEERLFVITPRLTTKSHQPVEGVRSDITNYVSDEVGEFLPLDVREKSTKDQVAHVANMFKTILEKDYRNDGYRVVEYAKHRVPFSCIADGIDFSFSALPAYMKDGVSVYKVKAENYSDTRRGVPETSCAGKGMIAAVNTGSRTLKSGETSFMLVAFDDPSPHQIQTGFNNNE